MKYSWEKCDKTYSQPDCCLYFKNNLQRELIHKKVCEEITRPSIHTSETTVPRSGSVQ